MKTVYVDIVFVVNFCVDFLVLYLSGSFLHIKIRIHRFIVASLIGGVYAVIIAVVSPVFITRLISQAVILVIMYCFSFGKRSKKTCAKIFASIYVVSFLFCGMITMFVTNVKSSVDGIRLLLLAALFAVVFVIVMNILRPDMSTRKVRVRIENSQRICDLTLLCDSGNLLVDPYNSLPVILIDKKYKDLLIKPEKDEEITGGIRLVPIKTVSGNDLVEVFLPDAIFLCMHKNIKVDASVGFVGFECFSDEECCGIFPSMLMNNY